MPSYRPCMRGLSRLRSVERLFTIIISSLLYKNDKFNFFFLFHNATRKCYKKRSMRRVVETMRFSTYCRKQPQSLFLLSSLSLSLAANNQESAKAHVYCNKRLYTTICVYYIYYIAWLTFHFPYTHIIYYYTCILYSLKHLPIVYFRIYTSVHSFFIVIFALGKFHSINLIWRDISLLIYIPLCLFCVTQLSLLKNLKGLYFVVVVV